MSAILNSLSAHTFLILHPILMKCVLKSVVYRALSYKTYLSIGLRWSIPHVRASRKVGWWVGFRKQHVSYQIHL